VRSNFFFATFGSFRRPDVPNPSDPAARFKILAHDRDRTGDLVLTKDVLYLLSYMGKTMSTITLAHLRPRSVNIAGA
jgi:hypothetical protein